jgi:hypothetical protein
MNIIQKMQKISEAKKEPTVVQAKKINDIEAEFLEIKKDLKPEVMSDIQNFQKKYTNLKAHVIYKMMKKHEFKLNLVDSELNFMSNLQPKRDLLAEQQIHEKELQRDELNKEKEKKAKNGTYADKYDIKDRRQNGTTYKPDKEYKQTNQQTATQDKNYRNYEEKFRQEYTNKAEYIPKYKTKQENQKNQPSDQSKAKYKQKNRGYNQNYNGDQDVYFVKKGSIPLPIAKVEEPPVLNLLDLSKESSEKNADQIKVKSSEYEHRAVSEKLVITRDKLIITENATNEPKYDINGLFGMGIQKLVALIYKNYSAYFKHLFNKSYYVDYKAEKKDTVDLKMASGDKKQNGGDPMKKIKSLRKNFATDENDEESSEARDKVHLNVLSKAKFESEEEKLKTQKDKSLESIIKDLSLQVNLLTQKTQNLEDEVGSLRSINQNLREQNAETNKTGSSELYCIVPFSLVKDLLTPGSLDGCQKSSNKSPIFKIGKESKI